jgi:hypothetical protein
MLLSVPAKSLPPVEPVTVRSSRARSTENAPMPLTTNRMNAWRMGDASTCSSVAVPKLDVAAPEST